MLRNDEFRLYFAVQLLIAVLALGAAALWIGWTAFGLVLVVIVLTYLNFYYFTRWRYIQLESLSHYLRQIASGDYTLNIRDNREGELSILKNEIFKVTMRLSEQSEYLLSDKERMSEAISDISHQLKTPLTSMGVMMDLLKKPDLPLEKQQQFLRYLQQQLERMEWLITSLLKLSKLEAGTVLFHPEQVKLSKLVQQAIAPIEIPIEVKEIHLLMQGNEETTLQVDQKWTIEAILNVIKNAVEHTPQGGMITISMSQNTLYTELKVTDSGAGIDREDLPHLFKRFYRGKSASDASVGIGLAMSYHILQAQNGVIEVENSTEQGQGAVFTMKWYNK